MDYHSEIQKNKQLILRITWMSLQNKLYKAQKKLEMKPYILNYLIYRKFKNR